jgi:hypothetical protein
MAMKKEEKYNRKNSTVLQLVSNAVFQSLESPGSATTFLKFFALVVSVSPLYGNQPDQNYIIIFLNRVMLWGLQPSNRE